jgi:hypothetical protein
MAMWIGACFKLKNRPTTPAAPHSNDSSKILVKCQQQCQNNAITFPCLADPRHGTVTDSSESLFNSGDRHAQLPSATINLLFVSGIAVDSDIRCA